MGKIAATLNRFSHFDLALPTTTTAASMARSPGITFGGEASWLHTVARFPLTAIQLKSAA